MKLSHWRFGLSAILTAVLLTSCDRKQSMVGEKAALNVREVRTTAVVGRRMSRSVFVTGTLAARERSMLSAKVPGRLEYLSVDFGSPLKEGMLLAQIEKRDYELRLEQARAALVQARVALGLPAEGQNDQVELADIATIKQTGAVLEEAGKNRERVKGLVSSGIAPQSDLDTAEAAYKVALARHETAMEEARGRMGALAERRAEYELAQKQLADTAVVAPFDGALQSRSASVGEYLAAGAPVVEVVKTDPLRLRLEVPERQSFLIQTGQAVRLWVESETNAYGGRIARLSPALEVQARVLLVEADVPVQGPLRPGLFARAEIVVNDNERGLSVPAGAVVTFAGVQRVFQVKDGRASERTVTTGRHGGDWIEITSGLGEGDKVIVEPGGLRTGQPVRVTASPRQPLAVSEPASH